MNKEKLMRDKHPQMDLFMCDVTDVALKDITPHMENPLYTLSKQKDISIKYWENGRNWVRIVPSVVGHPNIYDKDILIFAISQIMNAYNEGRQASKRINIVARDYLIFSNRGTGGKDYNAFVDSLDRLAGARISTNIATDDGEITEFFGLVDKASIKRKYGLNGRIQSVDMELSDWVFNAITKESVLTLHPDYFRLRKPIERRIYELARKHVGRKRIFKIGIEKLLNKTGSQSPMKKFKYLLQQISSSDHLPDYSLHIDERNNVVFTNKNSMPQMKTIGATVGQLATDTYHQARKFAAGWDVRMIEQEWRNWLAKGNKPAAKNVDKAFLAFVKVFVRNHGSA